MSTANPFVAGFPPLDFDRVLSQSVRSRATQAASAPASSGLEVAFHDIDRHGRGIADGFFSGASASVNSEPVIGAFA
jgi:hypothetical protein